MQLFYAPGITLPRYVLPAEESAHAVRVLRLPVGGELHITDGRGNIYAARVVRADPRGCEVEVTDVSENHEPLPYSLTVAVAPTKNADRFEWFLEKAVEVGVDRIVPLECSRSERRALRGDRALKVVTEAVKQSLKAYHPVLDDMTPFEKVVRMPFEGVKMIAHCSEGDKVWIGDCIREGVPALALIGPEGDFSPAEVALALENGFTAVTLGRSRLRTETAALATVFAFHDFFRL